MLVLVILASNVNLLFGALPESATVLLFGTCLIVSTIGIRRFFKHQDESKAEKNGEEKGK